jgi:hypothetical protein
MVQSGGVPFTFSALNLEGKGVLGCITDSISCYYLAKYLLCSFLTFLGKFRTRRALPTKNMGKFAELP